MRSLKFGFQFVIWILIFTFATFLTFFILGYYAALKPVAYIPEMQPNGNKAHRMGVNSIEIKRSYYKLIVNEYGEIIIKSKDDEVILSNLTYFCSYEQIQDHWGLDSIKVKLTSDSTVLISGKAPSDVFVRIMLTAHTDLSKIDFNINTHYNNNTVVKREALVADFNVKISEVYRKNRQIDVENFDSEYWLQKQGVRFGSGLRSALIYNSQYISSLQVDTKRNNLIINLDYSLDHPYIFFPYREDGKGGWINLSNAKQTAGNERNNNFSVYFGNIPKIVPRVMLVPSGFLAGYVFSEHADGGTIKTHRAAYFGSEEITQAKNAIGGFVAHRIPTTKSVFYTDAGGPPETSIKIDPVYPQFLNFLQQLYKIGNYDICLHTPDGSNSSREVLVEAIKFMKDSFDAITWIDHGVYTGSINRESFVCDGLNKESETYAADLWTKYKTLYFWNPAVEQFGIYSLKKNFLRLRFYSAFKCLWTRQLAEKELNKLSFFGALKVLIRRYRDEGELNCLKPNKGNAFPTPLFWQHPTRTGNFYSWATDGVKKTCHLSDKKVLVERTLLNKLVENNGIFLNHGYFVRNREDDDVISEKAGKLVINPYFDKILGIMAEMRDNGDLYVTTIRDLLNYWIQTENISFTYMHDGSTVIINLNETTIKGLSLTARAKSVSINNTIPKFRKTGENIIFWFDLPAGQSVRVQLE